MNLWQRGSRITDPAFSCLELNNLGENADGDLLRRKRAEVETRRGVDLIEPLHRNSLLPQVFKYFLRFGLTGHEPDVSCFRFQSSLQRLFVSLSLGGNDDASLGCHLEVIQVEIIANKKIGA